MTVHEVGAETGRRARTRRFRVVAAFVLVGALLLPLSLLFWRFWSSTGEDQAVVADERSGVVYLRPLAGLLTALDEAQAAAVRGQPVDTGKVRNAVAAVADVDRTRGAGLRVQERWASLRTQIEGVIGRALPAGRDAFNAYSENVDLLVSLAVKVGDESRLILDPQIDSYYLMDAALLRLPTMLVDAGRIADLPLVVAPLVVAPSPRQTDLGTPAAQQTEPVQVTAAKDRLSRSFAALDAGLRKSFDRTASRTLGQSMLGPLDAFGAAVRALAPGAVLIDPPVTRSDPAGTAATRAEVRRAGLSLSTVTLDELDKLLAARHDGLSVQRNQALAALIVAAVVIAGILWLRLPTPQALPAADGEPGELPVDEHSSGSPEADYPVERDLVDARQLLKNAELIHVGRGLRAPGRRDRSDDEG